MTPHEFLAFVFADKQESETVCVSKGSPQQDGDTLFWNVAPEHDAFVNWARRPQRAQQAWYFCVSSVNGTLNDKGTALRRRRGDLVQYHCLVLDDIGTKATPPPIAPAWKMETSENNYQWGYLLEPGAEWPLYEGLLDWAHEQGWGDGGAGGSYRVMRVPGSTNLKLGKERFLSEVEICDDIVWPLQELALELGADLDAINVKRSVGRSVTGAKADDLEVIDPLLTWLSDAGHIVEDTGGEWVTIKCPWYAEHTTGSDTAGYSPLGRGEGRWIETRAFKCQHEHCRDKHFHNFRDWTTPFGAPWASGHDPLPWLQARYVYVVDGKRVANMHQRPLGGLWRYDLEEWSMKHYGRVTISGHDRSVSIKTAFIESPETTKAETFAYVPGGDGLATQNQQTVVNTYIEPQHLETDERPAVFLDHMDYLLGDNAELFLDWLAWKIQNPDKRSYAVVMIADDIYGTGRSWIRAMLTLVLEGKVNTASLGQLVGKGTSAEACYNDWAGECQFLVIEEAKDNLELSDFYKGYETFKQRVDTRPVPFRCNPKYGKTRTEIMYFNCLIFTNHSDAMIIPEGDRRLCVLENPSEIKDLDYYERLNASLDSDEPARVFWHLKHRDVSKFEHVYPLMTPAKAKMIEQSRSPFEEVESLALESLEGDIVTRRAIEKVVRRAARELGYEELETKPGKVVGRLWRKLGRLRINDRNGARYHIDTLRVEVRAVRNREHWVQIDMTRDEKVIVDELLKNTGDNIMMLKIPK